MRNIFKVSYIMQFWQDKRSTCLLKSYISVKNHTFMIIYFEKGIYFYKGYENDI